MITSTKNPRVKQLRALQSRAKARREGGAFIVEGVRLAEEALAAGWHPQAAYTSEDLNPRGRALVETLRTQNIPLETLAPHVMKAASGTETPQGILLVLPMRELPQPEPLDFALVLDRVRDPGNLGTLLRSAAAAGVQAVLLTEGSADPFAPKVVRAGMGAHFRLPIETLAPQAALDRCREKGLGLWLAAAGQGLPYQQADLTQPLALVIGGEAHGVGDLLQEAAEPLHIPMPGGTESLNAAAAGAILLFEIVRQRTPS